MSSSGSSLSTASKSFGMPSSSLSSSPRWGRGRSAESESNSGSVPPATVSAATRQVGQHAGLVVGDVVVARDVVVGLFVVVVEAPLDLLAVGHHQEAVVADDDQLAARRDRVGPVGQVLLVHVVEQRGEVLAAHLPGDREAEVAQQRGRHVVGGGVPVHAVAALVAVRVADQVRDLVRAAVRGRGAAAEERVVAERDADVAEHVDERVVGHRVEQPADPVVHLLHVVAIGGAQRLGVAVAEVELHEPPAHRPDAVLLHHARAHVDRRGRRGVHRVERVDGDEEAVLVLAPRSARRCPP